VPESWPAVEVEDLPVQRVVASTPIRPPLPGLAAAAGLTLVLVAGLGLLGGRQAGGPANPAAVRSSSTPPASIAKPLVTPAVTWPVPVLSFPLPMAWLMAGARSIAVNPGCDIQVGLGSGGSAPASACHGSLASAPPVTGVGTGQTLTFSFSEGWDLHVSVMSCGQLSGLQFVPEPGCEIPFQFTDRAATFQSAEVPGTWTVAVAACATRQLPDADTEVCGTWYATVRVRK
jgi:hypothetical protein